MNEAPVVLVQPITWREGLTRKRREAFEERTTGRFRTLWAGDRYCGYGKVEAVLFVRHGKGWGFAARDVQGGGAGARYGLRWPRKVEVVVNVLSAKVDARRALGLDSSR